MPRYFIDLRDEAGLITDEEGRDYPNLEAALDEAKASARDVVSQYMTQKIALTETCIEVRDDRGRKVAAVTVAEVLRHPSHPHFSTECSGLTGHEHKPLP